MHQVKILIVEDQKIIARDIEGLLIDWGYHVVGCADTSEAALDLFITEEPDIALVDIHLCGETDGIDTVHKFNKIRPIPIVGCITNFRLSSFFRITHNRNDFPPMST